MPRLKPLSRLLRDIRDTPNLSPNLNANNSQTPSGEPEIGSGNISTSFEKK